MRQPQTYRVWLGLVVALVILLVRCPLFATEPEDELKSAAVLSFVRHADWSKVAPAAITVCVVGRSSMQQTLRRMLDGKNANGKSVRLIEQKAMTTPHSCQVLYVASDQVAAVRSALAEVRSQPILTIGETERFLELGGAVSLEIVEGRMSFEVSMQALDRARINVSSKLLRYGRVR